MICIGLTGGIGMGKSTAAALLSEQGIRVVDTDHLARDVVAIGQPALAEIRAAFGSGVLAADGSLNREAMAAMVFSDAEKRRQLEAILHPKIRERWLGCLAEWKAEGARLERGAVPATHRGAMAGAAKGGFFARHRVDGTRS